jgi:hypothetical protein
LYVPSSIKVTKTKLYSGELDINYPMAYQVSSSAAVRSSLIFDIKLNKNNADAPKIEISIADDPKDRNNYGEKTLVIQNANNIKNYLSKLSKP